MNRRLIVKGGKEWTIRRATPSPPDSDVVALGPVDPEIGILRLDRTDGHPLAVVYNFAVHAYGGVSDGGVTADLPGFASALIEQQIGGGAVALFVQGAEGDITPIRYKDVDAPPPTERFGRMLGLSTLEAVREIKTRTDATIQVISETVRLPRRKDLDKRIRTLKAEQEKILKFFTGVGCGAHGAGTFLNFETFLPLYLKQLMVPEHPSYSSYLYLREEAIGSKALRHLDGENRKRTGKYLESIRQMERLIRLRANLAHLQDQQAKAETGDLTAEIQAFKIGDFVLLAFPGELFTDVALDIKKRSPFPHTFVSSLSNGALSYCPTKLAYESQAYEDSLTPLAPEWRDVFEWKAMEILGRLKSNE